MRLVRGHRCTRALRSFVVAAAFFVAAVGGGSVGAIAQQAPRDAPSVDIHVPLPQAPEGFVEVRRGSARWEMPSRARHLVEPLFATWDAALPRLLGELGVAEPLPPIRVRVAVDPEGMAALAPVGAPPPPYAVGVAYPRLRLILLTLTAPETWERPDLRATLVHEMSHVALELAVEREDGTRADLPLWMVEGIAIYQARERSIERVQTLWSASFRGDIIPLDDLDERFPERPHQVDLAYAQSADFVAWLLRRSGPEKLGEMLSRLRRGQRFEVAVSQTWSAGIGQLEVEWREDLSNRFSALPLFATGGGAWALVALLAFVAWSRRKQRTAEIEARWATEDARAIALERAWARHRARLAARRRAEAEQREREESRTASIDEDARDSKLERERGEGLTIVTTFASGEARPVTLQERRLPLDSDKTFEEDLNRNGHSVH